MGHVRCARRCGCIVPAPAAGSQFIWPSSLAPSRDPRMTRREPPSLASSCYPPPTTTHSEPAYHRHHESGDGGGSGVPCGPVVCHVARPEPVEQAPAGPAEGCRALSRATPSLWGPRYRHLRDEPASQPAHPPDLDSACAARDTGRPRLPAHPSRLIACRLTPMGRDGRRLEDPNAP